MELSEDIRARIAARVCDIIRDECGAAEQSSTGIDPGSIEHHGVFVTVRNGGALRGCIGCLDDSIEFGDALEQAARGSVARDPRFPHVDASECSRLEGEVSVMSAMKPYLPGEPLDIGRDGLYVTSGFMRGLLLPQVASERNWSQDQFVSAVLEKAGLPQSARTSDRTRFHRFTVACIPFTLRTR